HPDLHSFPTRRSSDLALKKLNQVINDFLQKMATTSITFTLNIRWNDNDIIYVRSTDLAANLVVSELVWHGFATQYLDQAYQLPRSEEHTSELQSRENL